MKKTNIIIAVVFALNVNVLFAGNNENNSAPNCYDYNNNTMNALAPVTPCEAIFEDVTVSDISLMDVKGLTPVVPVEALFGDEVETEFNLSTKDISPILPNEATFEDIDLNFGINLNVLSPSTPAFADFE
ncbi:MAG: hypothetical protein Q8M08_05170 [Bacteroidales bacterium]|nr:hypothetical protein [Bacteroidales bacterium]